MNTSEIKPRTLITVLASHIREEADTIARSIIEQAKNSEVDYSTLVERFVMDKAQSGNISFTSFAKKAFEEIKNTDKLLEFKVELETKFRKNDNGDFEMFSNGEFYIRCELNHKTDKRWGNDTVGATGQNAHHVFVNFKSELASKMADITGDITDVELPTEEIIS